MLWLTGIIVLLIVYLVWIRPWQLRWGATPAEVARPMPGDELVPRPQFNATRAVTVRARPEQIYPWIVQIGFGRAGWYSYDWIDNLGKPSARELHPEWLAVKAGTLIPIFGEKGFWVRDFTPGQWMLWEGEGGVSWVWGLYPTADGQTRLITRVRMEYHWLSPTILFALALDVGDIIMMRKCLLGIKERAEAS